VGIWLRRSVKAMIVLGLVVAPLTVMPRAGSRAAAAIPSAPPGCPFTVSLPTLFQGAGSTLIIPMTLRPDSSSELCTTTVTASLDIVPSSGGSYQGISNNPDSVTVTLTFQPGRQDPVIRFGWAAYCATPEVSATFVAQAGGQTASVPYGPVSSCESKGFGGSGLTSNYGPVDAVGVSSSTDGGGYTIAGADGSVIGFGNAAPYGSVTSNAQVVGIAASRSGQGKWLAAADGGVFTLFGAPFFGSAGGQRLNAPVTGIAATPDGGGYWLVALDGGVFSYGDAQFYGSAATLRLNAPVVGMASTSDGHGYWLVSLDGGVFSYGDARFEGSAGSMPLNQPVVGIASQPGSSAGYWLVSADGGVFSYGATFFGSAAELPLAAPISAIAATPSGRGNWLLGADGGVFTYGDAPYK
jgi:hypothetical protein